MLSKEEIKKAIKVVFNSECHKCYFPKKRTCKACLDTNKKTIKKYIEQLEKSDASKEQSSTNYYNENKALKQDLDEAWEEWNNLNEYHCQEMKKKCKEIKDLKEDKQKLIDKLEEKQERIRDERSELGFKTYMKREHMIREDCELLGKQKAYREILSILKGEK